MRLTLIGHKSREILRALSYKMRSALWVPVDRQSQPRETESERELTCVISDEWVAGSFLLFLGRKVAPETIASRVHLSKKHQIKRLLKSREFTERIIPEILSGATKKRLETSLPIDFLVDVFAELDCSEYLPKADDARHSEIARDRALELLLLGLSDKQHTLKSWLDASSTEAEANLVALTDQLQKLRRVDALVAGGEIAEAFIMIGDSILVAPALFLKRYLALHYHLCWDLLSFQEILRREGNLLSADTLSAFRKYAQNASLRDRDDEVDIQIDPAINRAYSRDYVALFRRPSSVDDLKRRFTLWSVLKRFEYGRCQSSPKKLPVYWLMEDSEESREFVKSAMAADEDNDLTILMFANGQARPNQTTPAKVFAKFEDAVGFIRSQPGDVRVIATDRPVPLRIDALSYSTDEEPEVAISIETLEIHPRVDGLNDMAGKSSDPIGFVAKANSLALDKYDAREGFTTHANNLAGDRIVYLKGVVVRESEAESDALIVQIGGSERKAKQRFAANYTAQISISGRESASGLSAEIRKLLSEGSISERTPILILREDIEYHPSYESMLLQSFSAHNETPISAVDLFEFNGRIKLRQRHPSGPPAVTQVGLIFFVCASVEDTIGFLSQRPSIPLTSYFFTFDDPAIVPDLSPACAMDAERIVGTANQAYFKLETGPSEILRAAQNSIYETLTSSTLANSNPYYRFYISYKERAESTILEFTAGDIRRLEQIDMLLQADFLAFLDRDFELSDIQAFLKRMFSRTYALQQLSARGFKRLAFYAQKYGVQQECCRLGLTDVEAVILDDLSKARDYFQLLNGAVSSGELQAELMRIARAVAGARRFRSRSARIFADTVRAYAIRHTAVTFMQQVRSKYDAIDSSFLTILEKVTPLLDEEALKKIGFPFDPNSEDIIQRILPSEEKLGEALRQRDRLKTKSALDELGRGDHSITVIIQTMRSFSAEVSDMKLTSEDWPYLKLFGSSEALKIAIALGDKSAIAELTKHTSNKETLAIAEASTGSFSRLNSLYADWAKIDDVAPISFQGNSVQEVFKSVAEASRARRSSKAASVVSVVVSIFDGAIDLLDMSLSSILEQTHQDLEILLIDDFSEPHLSDAYRELVRDLAQVAYYRLPKNLGPYMGRNFALSKARGEFIAIQDADDFAHPQRLAKQLDILHSNPYLRAVTSPNLRFDRKGNVQFEHGLELRGDGTMATMFRSSVFKELGPFANVRSRGDVEFRERIVKAFGQNAFLKTECPLQFCYAAPTTLSQNVARERAQHLADFRTAIEAQSWPLFSNTPIGDLPIPTVLRP